jgi:iron only hydrogenase large subunit-like protein
MPIILATQEAEIRRVAIQSQMGQIVQETLSQKTYHRKGLAKCLKVWALSSNPCTAKKKKKVRFCILMH